MGCDIHLAVEVRKAGEWHFVYEGVPAWSFMAFQRATGAMPTLQDNSLRRSLWHGFDRVWRDAYPRNRNYQLFGFLAGVRDYSFGEDGRIGGRGMPGDRDLTPRSSETDDCFEEGPVEQLMADQDYCVYLGDHSFTHATLSELLGLDWEVPITDYSGYVTPEVRQKFLSGNAEFPDSWGYFSAREEGPTVVLHWRARAFPDNHPFRAWLNRLRMLGDPDDVRVLIGFDS